MLASQRYIQIIDNVNKYKIIDNKTLAEKLNVSQTTIRRDLEKLEQQGKLDRIHGGAKSIHQENILTSKDELAMKERSMIFNKEKDLICKKAATLVKDGDCIFLDGGTSISPMIKYLKHKKIKIVTHSQLIINEMNDEDNIDLLFIGGKFSCKYSMCFGSTAIELLSKYHFDHAFIGCMGIDLDKECIYTAEIDTLSIKKMAINQSLHSHLLIDASKINVKGFCSMDNYYLFENIYCNMSSTLKDKKLPHNLINL